MKSRIVVIPIAIVALSVGVIGVQASQGSGNAASAVPSSEWTTDVYLNHAAFIVGQLVQKQIAGDPNYSGVSIESDGLSVWAVGGITSHIQSVIDDPNTVAAGRSAMTGDTAPTPPDGTVPVSYRPVPYTTAQIQSVVDRITGDEQSLAAEGIHVITVSSTIGRTVDVGIHNLTPAISARLQATYGSNVTTNEASFNYEVVNRSFDYAPWLGADSILMLNTNGNPTGAECTVGFNLYEPLNGVTAALTAGHCGSIGQNVVNSPFNQFVRNPYGVFNRKHLRSGGNEDDATIQHNPQGASEAVWSDGLNGNPHGTSPWRDVVNFATGSMRGLLVCTDGANTHEFCQVLVDGYVTVTDNLTGVVTINMEYGHATVAGVTQSSQGGDSGGPVYEVLGGSRVTAVGLIQGSFGLNGVFYSDWTPMSTVFSRTGVGWGYLPELCGC